MFLFPPNYFKKLDQLKLIVLHHFMLTWADRILINSQYSLINHFLHIVGEERGSLFLYNRNVFQGVEQSGFSTDKH
jgi:hypothetical protein